MDLSCFFYRALRAVGGSWTEMLHSDAQLIVLASSWAAAEGHATVRIWPLCRSGAGAPRHVVMSCALKEIQEEVWDVMETESVREAPRDDLVAASEEWWARAVGNEHVGLPERARLSWPVLCSWQWLLPVASREALFGEDDF